MPIFQVLNAEMQRVKSAAPATYKTHVDDAEKRLNLLFDQLNCRTISPDGLAALRQLADAMSAKNYDQAQAIHATLAQFPELSTPAMVSHFRVPIIC